MYRKRQIKQDIAFEYLSKFLEEDELAALRLGADIRIYLERPVDAGVMTGYVVGCIDPEDNSYVKEFQTEFARKFIEIDTWNNPSDFVEFKDRIFACMDFIKVHATPDRAFY